MRIKLLGVAAVVAVGSVANATIVLDQLPTVEANATTVWNSQQYDPGGSFSTDNVNYIDDFSITTETHVTQVEAYMQGFGGFTSDGGWGSVTGFRVEIYSSVAAASSNLTGNVGSQTVAAGSITRTNLGWSNAGLSHNGTMSSIVIPVSITLPGSGTYFIGVMGILNEGASILQVGVTNNTGSSGGANAEVVNPDGGFGLPGNHMSTGDDAGYKVTASAPVPEPASMLALGLGAAALLARKRRKVA